MLSNGQFYVGSSNNLERRISEHEAGESLSTRYKRPVSLVFRQEFDTLKLARQAEFRLKKLKSRRVIEEVIKSGKLVI